MADPIDDLEHLLAGSVPQEALPNLYAAIDTWRHHHGGNRAYIARVSIERRHAEIIRLAQSGLSQSEIAKRVGVSKSNVSRVTSSYLR